MQGRQIENSQISASTDEGNINKARLRQGLSGRYWSAGSGSSESNLGWIQVDLRELMLVTGLATQAEDVNGQYSIRFRVWYRTDRKIWKDVRNIDDSDVHVSEFTANV